MYTALRPVSSGLAFQVGRFDELGLKKPLAGGAVEENLVSIGLPNRGEPGCPRSVQAEVNTTGFPPSKEDPFGHPKRAELKLITVTEGFVDKIS